MGESSKGTEASSRGSENNSLCTREAHHVDFSPQEDRSGAAEKVGEGTGEEEAGSVELWTRGENDSSRLQTEEKVYAACNRGGKTRP
jgi:hypothetical protein